MLNQGNEWTFKSGRGKSVIGVTFASPELASTITEWRVLSKEKIGSDHKLIQMKMLVDKQHYEYNRDLSKVDWQKFRNILDKHNYNRVLPSEFYISELEERAAEWEALVKRALNEVAPIKRKKLKDPLERWWNDEAQKAYDEWQEARFKPNKLRRNIKQVSDLKKAFSKIRKFCKRKVKREFYTNCGTPMLISKLEKLLEVSLDIKSPL